MKKKQGKKKSTIDLAAIKSKITEMDRSTLIQYSVMGAIGLSFLIFFFFPVIHQNGKMKSEISSLSGQIHAATVQISKVPELMKQRDQFGERQSEMQNSFFGSDEADQLIEIISATANAAEVRISGTRPSQSEISLPIGMDQRFDVESYDLVVEGSFHKIGLFVNLLEEYEKSFSISSLHLIRDKRAGLQLRCSLTVSAFLEKGKGV